MSKVPLTLALLMASSCATHASEPPEAVVQAMFAAFNRHDAQGMQALYADGARLSSSDFCQSRGRLDVRRTYQALFDAFPDIHDEVTDMVAEGNEVAVRFRASSTRGMSMWIHTFLTIRGGLIVRDDSIFDNGGRPCES